MVIYSIIIYDVIILTLFYFHVKNVNDFFLLLKI